MPFVCAGRQFFSVRCAWAELLTALVLPIVAAAQESSWLPTSKDELALRDDSSPARLERAVSQLVRARNFARQGSDQKFYFQVFS